MPSRLTARHYALLAAFTLAIYLPGRASLPPLDRDEPRYMEAAPPRCCSRGNYVDVRFQDQPRYLQPAGIYWLEAAAVAATGTLEHRQVWGWRIPSLFAVVGSTLLTATIGASLFGTQAGLVAAALLALSVLMTAEGRMATIDSTLLLSILLAEFALLRTWRGRHEAGPTPAWVTALYWAALGCGLMAQGGRLALIPGFGTPLALALTERDARWWKRLRPAWGVPLMLAIVLPWCVRDLGWSATARSSARRWGTNFLGKVASRPAGARAAAGLPPAGVRDRVLAGLGVRGCCNSFRMGEAATGPGTVPAVLDHPALGVVRAHRHQTAALCPADLSGDRHPGRGPPWSRPRGWALPRHIAGRILLGLYGIAWLVLGVGIAVAGPVLLWRLQHVVSPVASFVAVLATALVLAAAWLLWPLREPRRALGFVAAAALMTYASLFGIVLPGLRTIWLSPRIAAMVAQVRPCGDSVLASTSFSEPSLVFLVGPATRLVGPVAAADLLAHDPRCAMALVGSRDAASFQGATGGGRHRRPPARPARRRQLLDRQAPRPDAVQGAAMRPSEGR